MTAPVPPRRRDLRLPARSAQDNERLAAVTADDVAHSRSTARRLCTALYRRHLSARLDPRELVPDDE